MPAVAAITPAGSIPHRHPGGRSSRRGPAYTVAARPRALGMSSRARNPAAQCWVGAPAGSMHSRPAASIRRVSRRRRVPRHRPPCPPGARRRKGKPEEGADAGKRRRRRRRRICRATWPLALRHVADDVIAMGRAGKKAAKAAADFQVRPGSRPARAEGGRGMAHGLRGRWRRRRSRHIGALSWGGMRWRATTSPGRGAAADALADLQVRP